MSVRPYASPPPVAMVVVPLTGTDDLWWRGILVAGSNTKSPNVVVCGG